MDSASSDITTCKRLLGQLESLERIENSDILYELENIFYHLPPQVAPRLQRDLDQCIVKSNELLGTLFNKVESSDKSLLNLLLRLMLAFGNFRLAQISYHIDSPSDVIEPDVRYTPILLKSKWYDLTPLLPAIDSCGWKMILSSNLDKDFNFPNLRCTCRDLLTQKLHFYAIVLHLDRFKSQSERAIRNGEKVAEKLAESIFEAANSDDEVVILDCFLFDLLLMFTNNDQQTALLEAIITARFKTISPELDKAQCYSDLQLDRLISECVLKNSNLQEIFIIKLIEHLKGNLVRRKRRLSSESDEIENAATFEGVLEDIISGANFTKILTKTSSVEVKTKTFQQTYLEKWVEFTLVILARKTLTPQSSSMILMACASILISCSKIIQDDLNTRISLLLFKTIDATSQRKLDKLFKLFNTDVMIELTKLLAETTSLLDHFETPLMRFYKSYLGKHMRLCTIRHFQKDVEKLAPFVEFICDRTVGKDKSTILGYIYLSELSEVIETMKTKSGSKSLDLYVDYGRSIGKKLYSFIKKRPFTKLQDVVDENHDDLTMNGSEGDSIQEINISRQVQVIVIDALVCVLKIAVNRKEQLMLDTYGELMLKLYNLMCIRLEEMMQEMRAGFPSELKPIDTHLHRLISLYTAHRETIEPYLCYDLMQTISEKLLVAENIDLKHEVMDKSHSKRKSNYAVIKTKLEQLQKRNDELVYQTIINRQYSSVVDQNLGQVSDITREDCCSKRYLNHVITFSEVLTILFINCEYKTYEEVLFNITKQFESCDALDHPRVLNLLCILKALIPKQTDKNLNKAQSFKNEFSKLGCCLIRLAKSVELGPSVLSFTNPGTHKFSGGIQCCTYSNCISIYTLIFNRFPPSFTNTLITDAMQVCVSSNLIRYAKYSSKLHKYFIELATSIANLLKSICMGKRDIVEQAMPVFLSVFSLLIRCIILASDRQKLEGLPKIQTNGHLDNGFSPNSKAITHKSTEERCTTYESQLERLARDIGRLLNNLCFLETKLVDYAPHLISTYIKDTQRASCPDFVKKHLDEGIFRIFNLVDSHQKDKQEQVVEAGIQRKTLVGRANGSLFEMVHSRLDQASREIFKDMHENYNKFHRYLGKC